MAAALGIILSLYDLTWIAYVGYDKLKNVTEFSADIIQKFDNDKTTAHILVISLTISAFLHILWFISSLLLVKGNRKGFRNLLCLWICNSSLIVLQDLIFASYFTYKVLENGPPDFRNTSNSTDLSCTIWKTIQYPVMFGKGGIFLIIIIFFIVIVNLRRRKISKLKESREMWGTTFSLEKVIPADPIYENSSVVNPAISLTTFERKMF